jgi:pyruvate dehydrogenase complex dehydrogenase (E1) component
VSVLSELARRGEVDSAVPQKAVEQYDLRSEDVPADKDTTVGAGE